MKTITIKQPWANLICEGIKDIENRTWPTKFRGRVLIHAGLSFDIKWRERVNISTKQIEAYKFIQNNNKNNNYKLDFLLGAIIGSVEIVDCVIGHESIWAEETPMPAGCYMGEKPIYNWVLANPILFPEPIPAKGKLSFWDYPNILAEPEEKDGKLFCHCHLPIKEENQVMRMHDHFRCRYCGGIWYK